MQHSRLGSGPRSGSGTGVQPPPKQPSMPHMEDCSRPTCSSPRSLHRSLLFLVIIDVKIFGRQEKNGSVAHLHFVVHSKTQLSSYFYVESLSVPRAFPASCLSIQSGRTASQGGDYAHSRAEEPHRSHSNLLGSALYPK